MMINNRAVGILGTGSYLPDNIVTNKDLEQIVDTTEEWIVTRTGIKERRKASPEMATSDMGARAAERALAHAGISAAEIDMILVATVTPDMLFPSTAALIQAQLGATKAAALDISAACSGFIYGLALGSQMIATGLYKHVLVIGAETISRILDPQDRSTLILFGDGAGAAVLGPVKEGRGILSFDLGSDGTGADLLYQEAGGSRLPLSQSVLDQRQQYVKMNGHEVFKFAVKIMGETSSKSLEKAGLNKEEVDFLIPHQANLRIVDAAVRRLKLPTEKVFINLDRYGNMSGASVPVALDEAWREGKIKSGDNIVLVGFGAGLTWASCVIRWS